MPFKIYRFSCDYPTLKKEGFLLHSETGEWSEVSPFPGKNRETLSEVLEQLKAIQDGWTGKLFPSVEFGLHSLSKHTPSSWPVCLLLMGSPQEILKQAEASGYTTAKIKLGDFDIGTARTLTDELKSRFRLRIDLQEKWTPSQTRTFCSYFQPTDFDFIEDPGSDITPYPMKTEATDVWKPMVRGIPPKKANIILSSTFESGIGIRQIVALAEREHIPRHPLGIGTYSYLNDDLLEEPLIIRDGEIHFPQNISVKKERLKMIL